LQLREHVQPDIHAGLSSHARRAGGCRPIASRRRPPELDSRFEWEAHEPEALGSVFSREIIEIIKYRKDTNGLDEADAIVIELGREIFGARKGGVGAFARSLRQFGRRALVDLVAPMGNYAGTAVLLTAFDMQLDPGQPPLLPP
jgi:4-carboxymuconolactone decarboxylase